MFTKKTIKDIDIKEKRVLLRADYNVPVDEKGEITDDYRIQQSLPTINYLIEHGAKLIICSHMGRPNGKPDPKLSLFPVAKRLRELLKREVEFVTDCIGERAEKAAANLNSGQIVLLENLRFHAEEEKDDDEFARHLAELADIFVQDGFGVVHRKHASTDAITRHLPSVSGLLVEKEIDTITESMDKPLRPLVAIIGGAKISDKIDLLHKFIEIADVLAVGGAMANTFLLAEGVSIGKSLSDPSEVLIAKDIIATAKKKSSKQDFVFYIPQDGVVSTSLDQPVKTRIVDWSAHVIAAIENYPKRLPASNEQVKENEMILDIGPFSGAFIAGCLQLAGSVIWNGTVGVTETSGTQGPIGPFAHGTDLIIEAMLGQFGHRPRSLVGGGDTVGYVEERRLVSAFDHVSTGGGASLELMTGHKLPGVEVLENKQEVK